MFGSCVATHVFVSATSRPLTLNRILANTPVIATLVLLFLHRLPWAVSRGRWDGFLTSQIACVPGRGILCELSDFNHYHIVLFLSWPMHFCFASVPWGGCGPVAASAIESFHLRGLSFPTYS